jgi:cysteine desulfurase/selenocysteine lyase
MEHHSNIVPWQLRGCKIKVIPMNDKGELNYPVFEKMISKKTKLVSVVHISNSLGTINPIKKIIKKAHEFNVPVLIDGAQSAAHTKIDVQKLDCDFFVFSGHKMYGPTGVGILYGKEKLLNEMLPYQGGGDMIKSVKFEKTIYNDLPYKFEAGTPNIAGVIGLGAAIDYINRMGIEYIQELETELLSYATKELLKINGLQIIGTAKEKSSIISFVIENLHPHDIGTILDREGIAVRSGQHCTEPVMDHFKVPATTRVSFGIYNEKKDVDALVKAIIKAKKIFNV